MPIRVKKKQITRQLKQKINDSTIEKQKNDYNCETKTTNATREHKQMTIQLKT